MGPQALWDLLTRGLLRGGLFASMAMGLSLVVGVMNVSNFAHGEFLMLGAYVAFFFVSMVKWPPLLAIALAGVVGFGIGIILERLVLLPLRRHSKSQEWMMNSFIVTVGLSFVIVNLMQYVFGAKNRAIARYYPGSVRLFSDMGIASDRVIAFVIPMITILGLWAFLSRTRTGRAIRAASQDEDGARIVGINLDQIYPLTFGLSATMGALSGASLLPLSSAFPSMGALYTAKSWYVVTLAGLGNFPAAIPTAFIVGVLETLGYQFFGGGWQDVPVLTALVVMLLVKPSGLFGTEIKS